MKETPVIENSQIILNEDNTESSLGEGCKANGNQY